MTAALSPDAVSSLLAGPAATPPPGVTPNFVNPTTIHPATYACLAVTWFISTAAVSMRLFTRWRLTKSYVIEDLFILIAWMFVISHGIICIVCTHNGVGLHQWDQTLSTYLVGSEFINIAAIIYGPAIVFIKLAIMFQFLRLFAPTRDANKVMFFTCWANIIILVLFYLTDTILIIWQCTPRKKIWDPFVPGHCVSESGLFIAAALVNVITDVIILVLPMPAIWKLQMKTEKKIKVASLFATGALACIASIVRTYYSFVTIHNPDTSWYYDILGICTWWEFSMGILVFCLPVTPRFYQFTKDKLYSSLLSRNQSTTVTSGPQEPDRHTWADKLFKISKGTDPMSLGVSSVEQYRGARFDSFSRLTDPIHLSKLEDGNESLENGSVKTARVSESPGPTQGIRR